MSNPQSSNLFILIKSLEKSEKRAFKLFISRSGNREEMKIIKLFDAIDKQQAYDEAEILKKEPEIAKGQLSNLKAHLYQQILSSLRIIHTTHNPDMQIRKLLDFTKILYNKGLYMQCLRILDKARNQAREASRFHLYLEVLEFEKVIENQFITRSIENRAELLTEEVKDVLEVVKNTHNYSNLALRMYGIYIKTGHVKNEEEYLKVKDFFHTYLEKSNLKRTSFSENMYYHIAHAWYYYIIQDFIKYYDHSAKWVELFEKTPGMIDREMTWYLKGLHNLLTALFITGNYDAFIDVLNHFESFEKRRYPQLNENERIRCFIYRYTALINRSFMDGDFEKGVKIVDEIEESLKTYGFKIDNHRILLFYYKIGNIYFGNGDFSNALKYLNKIINFRDVSLREDLHVYARILILIIHYEMGDESLLEYQIKSVYRFLGKMNDVNEVHKEIFNFLRHSGKIYPQNVRNEFKNLMIKFEQLASRPYEKRPFYYLDIIAWLQSKIENKSISEVIKERLNK